MNKTLNKGDLFIYRFSNKKQREGLDKFFGIYIGDDRFYFTYNECVYLSGSFSTWEISKMEILKNFNIDNMIEEDIKKLVILSKEIIREDKIDLIIR